MLLRLFTTVITHASTAIPDGTFTIIQATSAVTHVTFTTPHNTSTG